MINNERLIKDFMHYVTINSESSNEKTFGDYITDILIDMGFEIIPDDTGIRANSNGNNIIARLKGTLDGPTIGFCAHLDTVEPGIDIEPIIEDDIIKSKGDTILGADDKAGIAAIIESIRVAIETNIPLGDIELFFSICEENGIKGTRYFDTSVLEAKNYYILDGTDDPGGILIQGPATNNIQITVHGVAAHAGLCPENGVSAIEVVSKAIAKMKLGRINEKTTANIGIISGGQAVNVVCPEVTLSAEVRSLSNEELKLQTDHMHDMLKEVCDEYNITFNFDIDHVYQAFKIEQDNEFLNFTRKCIESLGLPYHASASGGGSDANNLSIQGITPIILGIGMKDCHTTNESIAIKHLVESSEMCYEFLRRYWN